MAKKYLDKIHRVNCLMEDVDSVYHQAAIKFGMSDSAMFVLYMAYIHDGTCPLYNIYKQSGISKQTINSALRKLEGDGLIYLENQTGKTKLVCFTKQGKTYAEQTVSKLVDAECAAFADWTEAEIDRYLDQLERYNRALKKQIEQL